MDFVQNRMDPEEKAIIFCGKKARADDLSSEFSLAGICCQCIHGNRDQADREQALVDIKDGVVKILIATDVASRGIDIQDLSYVINYDFPRNIEEYVHVIDVFQSYHVLKIDIFFFIKHNYFLFFVPFNSVSEELDELVERAKAFHI